MQTRAAILYGVGVGLERRGHRARRPEGRRGQGQAGRLRPVPLRRAPRHRRHGPRPRDRRAGRPRAVPDHRRPRGRRRGRRGRARASPRVAVGDHVVLGFIPSLRPLPVAAPAAGSTSATSAPSCSPAARSPTSPPATTPRTASDLGIICCTGTFSPYTVVSEATCIKIEPHIPLDKAALVGCGVTTGWGAATYAADVQSGETVVVIGIGGIGMNAVQGAAMAGARHVVAVDPVEWKRDAGQDLRCHPHGGVDRGGRRRWSARSPGAPTPTRRSSPPAWPPATSSLR